MTGASGGLDLHDLSVRYGARPILRGVTLPDLRPGTITALIGPNGAGKSTLLRGLAGFGGIEGRVMLDGRDVTTLPGADRAKQFGYLPQSLPPAIDLTVLEALIGALKADHLPWSMRGHGRAVTATALQTLHEFGIGPLADRFLSQLSGGQRQIAGLAQIVARRPRVLLLDEPTSALDLRYQIRVLRRVSETVRAKGLIALIVMHDISLAARVADRIAVLADATLYGFGDADHILTSRMLADVYGVAARVERCSAGSLQVIVDHEIADGP